MKRLLVRLTFIFSMCSLAVVVSGIGPVVETRIGQHGYFVSIDGLRPDYLKAMVSARMLDGQKGMGWLLKNSARADRALPVDISITASSHASTITCSRPGNHGVIANTMFEKGQTISGFSREFESEAFFESARKQGKKVLAIGYVGADGLTPRREVDVSVAYPDSKLMGASQSLDWNFSDLAEATGWNIPETLVQNVLDQRETQISVELNPTTKEKRVLDVLLLKYSDKSVKLALSQGKDLATSGLGVLSSKELATNGSFVAVTEGNPFLHVFFTESDAQSPLVGFKRRVFFRLVPAAAGSVTLYQSAVSYNNVLPAAFRKKLDDKNMVWPDQDITVKFSGGRELHPVDFVRAGDILTQFEAEVARFAMDEYENGFDVILFYQHLIDSLGHKYEAALPQPFNPKSTDAYSLAYVEAFQRVDRNLSKVFKKVGDPDVIFLMGDHGMDPVKKQVNIAALAKFDDTQVKIISSGALTMVYSLTDKKMGDAFGLEIEAKLKETSFEGKPVMGTAYRKKTSTDLWNYGEADWAFTSAPSFWLRYSAKDADLFLAPPALGMHGHDVGTPNMSTILLMHGPGLSPKTVFPKVSLIDAVPTFAGQLGLKPPANCLGKDLFAK